MDNGPSPLGERVVLLEARISHLVQQNEEALAKQRDIIASLEKVNSTVSEMKTEIVRYKGFLGGVTLVLTGVVSILLLFKTWFFAKMGLPQ